MCEYIDKKTPVEGFVAKEDILCYKILKIDKDAKDTYKSVVFSHIWNVGKTYGVLLTCRRGFGIYECNRYLPKSMFWTKTYINYDEVESWNPATYRLTDLVETESGFYSYTRYMNEKMKKEIRLNMSWVGWGRTKLVVGRFFIPKGCCYYVNEDASIYISEKLRFDGVVDIEYGNPLCINKNSKNYVSIY